MSRVLALSLALLLLAAGAGLATYTWLRVDPAPGAGEAVSEAQRPLAPAAAPDEPERLRPQEASVAHEAALAILEDGEWAHRNAEAIAALEAGELARAVELFEACLAARPEELVFARNLAEALARLARALWESGEVEPAEPIALLERALELAPEREDLVTLLARWKKTAETEAGFWTDETAHFLLSYDGDRRDLLRRGYLELERMLESAYDEFGIALNHWPVGHGDSKIRVVLYLREEFEDVTGIGHWAGGVYDGVVRVPVADLERQKAQIEGVLRHELVHAFVRSMGGKEVPAWLNEGLAQWHEVTSPVRRAGAVERARGKLRGRALFPLSELQGSLATWKDEDRIARGYAQSLVLVDYLAHTYGEFLLHEMLAGCRAGESCGATFRGRTGVDLDGALEDLGRELQGQ